MNIGRTGGRAAAALLALTLAGCAGGSATTGREPPPTRSVAVALPTVGSYAGLPVAADGTAPVPMARLVTAERGRQGVILRVEGIAPTQGFHTPEIRSLPRGDDGVETVELRAEVPTGPAAVGPEATRVLTAGRFYSNREMRDIRSFRLIAAGGIIATAAP